MKYTHLIDSCQAHLPVQYASNITFIRQKWHWCRDWQRATHELHVQIKPLVFSIGSPRSLIRFTRQQTVNTPTIVCFLLNYNFYILDIYNKKNI